MGLSMATLNRILSILILILAIGAAVLSYFLFERRNQFRERADELATTVAEMVDSLDRDSQTNVSSAITFTPGDPATGAEETGTLGWQAYQEAAADGDPAEFDQNLNKARELADVLNEQRNRLAEKLAQVGAELEMPQEQVDPAQLKTPLRKTSTRRRRRKSSGWQAPFRHAPMHSLPR